VVCLVVVVVFKVCNEGCEGEKKGGKRMERSRE
jgi:hypothetical protein